MIFMAVLNVGLMICCLFVGLHTHTLTVHQPATACFCTYHVFCLLRPLINQHMIVWCKYESDRRCVAGETAPHQPEAGSPRSVRFADGSAPEPSFSNRPAEPDSNGKAVSQGASCSTPALGKPRRREPVPAAS